MDCAAVASRLVGYHFATLEDDERDAIDTHLLGCQACLGTYLALKRASDRRPLERPSAEVKARLRASVLAAFPAEPVRPRRTGLLARRIPLYQGVFAAALAAVVAWLVPPLLRSAPRGDARDGAADIDTARPRAAAFKIY
jgi:anti-sigma factor RsiW